jgi:hypothetical protein
MKKIFIAIFLAFLLPLCIIFTMSNCKEDTDEDKENDPVIPNTNPFIGTWRSIESGCHDVFTNNVVTVYKPDKNIYWKATYTYDDTYVTVKLDNVLSDSEIVGAWGDTALLPYIFNDGYLFLNTAQLEKCDYDFIP